MTFDNTFSTPISVLKFMYDTEKKMSNLLTSPVSNIISTFTLETAELVVANETIPVPKSSVNVEPNANYLDKIVLVFKNYISSTGKTYIVYSKITEIQEELFVVSVISTEYFNELSLNPRNGWISGNEYHINDIVNSNNALYISIKSIISSTIKPENDTEHFKLWLSAPTSDGSTIKSVTYDNTTLDAHLTEIQNHLNSENGGTLLSIVVKITGIFNVDFYNAYIGATETSAFKETGIWGDETFVLYPQSRTGEHTWHLSNDKYDLPLDNTLIMQMFRGHDFGQNVTRVDFSSAKINLSGKTLEHLTINYME